MKHNIPSQNLPSPPPIAIGIDWGDSKHAFAISCNGQAIETGSVNHTSEDLHQWLKALECRFKAQTISVILEAGSVPLIAALREYHWIRIFCICPLASAAYRKSIRPSGAKDDRPDATLLLAMLLSNHQRLSPLPDRDDSQPHLLDRLVFHRRGLVDDRTALTNRLAAALKSYFPQALELLPKELFRPFVASFLRKWPNLLDLKKARPNTIERFYLKGGHRKIQKIQAHLERIKQAQLLHKDHALTVVGELQVTHLIDQIECLSRQIAQTEKQIRLLFKDHENASFYRNLPGAGPNMAPRLLAAMELLPTDNVQEAQKYIGVAPVTERSGKQCWVHRRFHPPQFLHQTFVEWAGLTVQFSPWAKAYYQHAKRHGKKQYVILRALAFKWLRILFACIKTKTDYDEQKHIQNLIDKKVPWANQLQPSAT